MQLKSTKDFAAWCAYTSFHSNAEKVAKIAIERLESDIIEQTGLGANPDDASLKKQFECQMQTRGSMWANTAARLSAHAKEIAIALSRRLVEIAFDLEWTVDDPEFANAVQKALGGKSCPAETAKIFMEFLESDDASVFKELQHGKAYMNDATISPIKGKPVPKPPSAPPAPPVPPAPPAPPAPPNPMEAPSDDDFEMLGRPSKGRPGQKRQRTPTSRLADIQAATGKKANKDKEKEKENDIESNTSGLSSSKRNRKPYNCTGLYSKDPLKAALARANIAAGMGNLQTPPAKGDLAAAGVCLSSCACV